jgi:hypothetical protein
MPVLAGLGGLQGAINLVHAVQSLSRMKNLFAVLLLAMIVAACGQPSSRDTLPNDGIFWLMKDGQAQLCIETLRRQGRIGYNQPVALYPDYVNIFAIRQNNPQAYSATETEFKNLCASIGVPITSTDPSSRAL